MAKSKKYSLAYWVKQNSRLCTNWMDWFGPALRTYVAERAHPEIEFEGEPVEFALALYNEYWKRGKVWCGAYMTPLHTAILMGDMLHVGETDVVLDPCAGLGSLLYGALVNCAGEVHGFEYRQDLAAAAQLLGFGVQREDFLQEGVGALLPWPVTKVVVNPPYGNMQGYGDIALPFMEKLAGMRVDAIAALLPLGWMERPRSKRHAACTERFAVLDREEQPADTFKPLTGMRTTIYILKGW